MLCMMPVCVCYCSVFLCTEILHLLLCMRCFKNFPFLNFLCCPLYPLYYDWDFSGVVICFNLTQNPRKEVNAVLKKEAAYFGDIVILPFMDRYELVVLKTIAICEFGVSLYLNILLSFFLLDFFPNIVIESGFLGTSVLLGPMLSYMLSLNGPSILHAGSECDRSVHHEM